MKTGIAFPDYITTEKVHKRRYKEQHVYFMRDKILLILFLLASGALAIRLFYLQIMHGSYYRLLSDVNRTRTKTVHAPRGIIFDRKGEPLVYNMPGFRQIDGEKATIIDNEKALQLLSEGKKNIEIDSLRQYPLKEAMSHVLGYVGQVTKEELEDREFSGYGYDDFLGKTGIEREYEHLLRGIDGKQLVEVDAMGKPLRILGQKDPVPGQDITLTIDSELQKVAYDALKDIPKGVVIVSTPKGEILTMVSKPSYDSNMFTLGKNYKIASDSAYKEVSQVLLDGQNQPLLNRAIGGVYPPGSTFKIVTAAAGLEDNIIDEHYSVKDTGVMTIGQFSFANWYYTEYGRKEEGDVNVVRALSRSNDIFFYQLAQKVNEKRLSKMAEAMGGGQKLGIDLSGEATGRVPSDGWNKKTMGEGWYLGDTFHYGIGQGYLLTTPLQVNAWTQVIANEGTLYQPHLLNTLKDNVIRSSLISTQTQRLIREGMVDSCSTGGVAWPFFDFKVKNDKLIVDGKNFLDAKASGSAELKDYRKVVVACKTGTAQHGDEETLPHSWITLFAPAYDPEIVVTVLAESSGEGSNVAAPIAKKIVEKWFQEEK